LVVFVLVWVDMLVLSPSRSGLVTVVRARLALTVDGASCSSTD
jgi:hypothetical protein